jgi:hypothetical protein
MTIVQAGWRWHEKQPRILRRSPRRPIPDDSVVEVARSYAESHLQG